LLAVPLRDHYLKFNFRGRRQAMRRALVGTRGGKPVINWPVVVGLGLVVGAVTGAAGSLTWFLLTQEFSVAALVFPLPLAVGYFIGEAVRVRYFVPVAQLPVLDE
jgi:hypothetical protein